MKRFSGLAIGVAIIGIAFVLAAGQTNQARTPQPEMARALATELHMTPSATPTIPPTPTPTPVPVHITRLEPQAQQVLDLLFHYPYQGTTVVTTNAHISMQLLRLEEELPLLIVTGDRLEGGRGRHVASGAFGALLSWNGDEYVVKFLRVAWGHGYMQATVSTATKGHIVFSFSRLDADPNASALQRLVMLQPCSALAPESVLRAIDRQDDLREWQCF